MLPQKAKDFTISFLNDVYSNEFMPLHIKYLTASNPLQVSTFKRYGETVKQDLITFITDNTFEDSLAYKESLLSYIKKLALSVIYTTDEHYNNYIQGSYFKTLLHNMESFCNLLISFEGAIE